MQINDLVKKIDGELIAGEEYADMDVHSAYSADLLSDVLALTEGDTLLITGTVSLQVMRVSEILGITGIVFIRGKKPTDDVMNVARKRLNIPIIVTKKTMFEVSGILFSSGIRPCTNRPANEV